LLELAQSLSAVQLVLHVVALAQMRPPGQGADELGLQAPVPLQVGGGVKVKPEHDAVPHVVLPEG
jgi:hypothetical protein